MDSPDIWISRPENVEKDLCIWATGGRVRSRTLGSTECYSFRSNQWVMGEYLADNRGSHGCASVSGTVFVIGGGGFKTNLATCERFDSATGKWVQIRAMTSFRHALAVVAVERTRSIWAIGGWADGSRCCADVERYDVDTDSWQTCAPLLLARRLLAACSVEGQGILVFGGQIQNGAGGKSEAWFTSAAEKLSDSDSSWLRIKDVPGVGGPMSAVGVGPFAFVFVHGRCVYRYDPLKDEYKQLSDLPLKEWFCFDVCSRGTKVFLVGGKETGRFSKAAFSYCALSDAWARLPDMNKQRRRCGVSI